MRICLTFGVLDLEIREMVADKKKLNLDRTRNLTDSADNGIETVLSSRVINK